MGKITSTPQNRQIKLSAPVPLTAGHDLSGFDCGDSALNDWLKQRALKNKSRFSRTYVVCADNRCVAYFSISAGAIERASAPGKVRRNAPDTIPVSVIGRLAVSRDYAGRGLEDDLLPDALHRIAVASQTSAWLPCWCTPKNVAVRSFHLACAEFIEYPEDSRTLFLPIEIVIAAFS